MRRRIVTERALDEGERGQGRLGRSTQAHSPETVQLISDDLLHGKISPTDEVRIMVLLQLIDVPTIATDLGMSQAAVISTFGLQPYLNAISPV